MKLSVKAADLRDLFATVGRATARGHALPILSHVLLQAGEGQLRARATDFEISLCASAAADVEAPGSITLPAAPLGSLAAALPDGEVHLDVDAAHEVTVTSGFSEYKLRGLPPDDFPALPEVSEGACTVRLPAGAWQRLGQLTVYAASTDNTRSALTGCALKEVNGGRVKLVATDTHRLAVAWADAERSGAAWPASDLIIPARSIREMMRLEGETLLRIGEVDGKPNQLLCECGGVTLTSRLVDAGYPNFERVIPRDLPIGATVAREALLAAIRRLLGVGADELRLVMAIGDGRLTLSARAGELGGGQEVLPCEQTGTAAPWAYNAHYLRDALTAIDSEKVVIRRPESALSPGLALPEGSDCPLAVLMPMGVK